MNSQSTITARTDLKTQGERILVAVYGTLRSGEGNHRSMVRAQGVSLGLGKTVDNINIYSLGGFPKVSMTRTDHGVPVVVEVFETNEAGVLGPLDGLEGYPRFYNRSIIDIELDSGEVVKAWMYHIESDDSLNYPILSGDWCNR